MAKNKTLAMPDIAYRNPNDLHVDPDYQREFKLAWGKKIRDDFDPNLYRPPLVAQYDGKEWVVAGQHTTWACKELGYTRIPVRLVDMPNARAAADLFTKDDTAQKALTPLEKHKAKVTAEYPANVATQRLIDLTGWTIGHDFKSVAAAVRLYEIYGFRALEQTLTIVRKANDYCDYWALTGVATFIGENPTVDLGRVEKIVVNKYVKLGQLINSVGQSGSGGRGRQGARVVREFYNKGLHAGNRVHNPE